MKTHIKQDLNDGVNCGVYVCKYFEILITTVEANLHFLNDKTSMNRLREDIYMELLASSDCSPSYCANKINQL